jgi:hypothetical protein
MFTMAIGQPRRDKTERRASRKALRIALVLGILVLLSAAVNTLTIVADGGLRRQFSTVEATSIVAQKAGGIK